MTGLKYGRVFISKGDILKALGLPLDAHLELVGEVNGDGTIEFQIVANDSVEHECLVKTNGNNAINLRRFHVPLNTSIDKE